VACDGGACTGHQFEQYDICDSHVRRQHRFDLVFWLHAANDSQGSIKFDLIGRSWAEIGVQRMVRGRIP